MKISLKIKTVESASLIVSLVAAVLTAVFGALCGGTPLYICCGTIVLFAAVWWMTRFVLTKFITYKIKPIFRIMTSRNLSTGEISRKISGMDNIVEEIRDELTHWANKKSDEIARLRDNERYRREFLGNVSHEIKTPIFSIQGYILTLLDGAMEDRDISRNYLERTEKNIERLINIVNDLDEISLLETGTIDLQRSNFNIVKLAREIADSLDYEALRRSITITVNAVVNSPKTVFADRSRIGQVLVNLLSNSIKYGREEGRTEINFIDAFDKVIVEITDDGIGIDEDNRHRIFERFFRVDKSRSREQGGTGLGLAIVKHIIEAHGETITLRSEPGKGTTFSFTLAKGEKF